MRTVKEEQLAKALSDLESIVKSEGATTSKMPKSTAQANGGLSDEGDKEELSTSGGDQSTAAKSLQEWAEENEEDVEKAAPAGDDDDSSSSDDDDDSSSSDDEPVSKCKKSTSLADVIKSDSATGPVIDASPFIEALVEQVSKADQRLRKSVDDSFSQQAKFNAQMQKAVSALGNVVLEMNKKVGGLMESPTGERKSVLSKSEINERFEEAPVDFTKSQVLDAMFDLVKSGSRDVTPIDITKYESSNFMEPNVRQAVEGVLRRSA